MIEDTLIQYGVLGIWTATLLGERYIFNRQMKKVVESNTVALTKVHEVMKNGRNK
jgi:hypothetical protein|tara:strand:- start:2189 stop:2353 length:165 start_codon:yes stop_codon:yes gene_type:complete